MNSLKSAILLFLLFFQAKAFGQQNAEKYPDYQEDVFMDMSISENIITPQIPGSAKQAVQRYQRRMAQKLKTRYTVDMMRDDEVIVVCIPTDELFLPNDTLFSEYATGQIAPLFELMNEPYTYKILLAIHTDDTGSEFYRQNLATARIYSAYDLMMDAIDQGRISEDIVIIPYAMADTEPLVANDTRKHRKENRRLEIYFIPGPEMIENARKGTLK